MAQLDIKNCEVYIRDGYTGPSGMASAAVNNASGYAIGATTMAVDGITGVAVVGDYFTVGSRPARYRITSKSDTLGNTTSITFTPGLVTAAVDNDAIEVQPHQLQIKVGEGNATWTEKRMVTYVKDRGRLDTLRLGDEDPVEVKLDFTWEFLKADTGQTPTIEDALKRRGVAADWISSSSDLCEPYAVDIVIEYIPPCTTEKMEIYTLSDYRYEELAHDLKAGTVSTSGKCNILEALVERVTYA